jgi:hypothetical protein
LRGSAALALDETGEGLYALVDLAVAAGGAAGVDALGMIASFQ